MDRLQAMKIAVAVADHQGFIAAARALRLSAPTVSRAIGQLEELIGSALFTRTTRSVTLTETGQQYIDDCRRIIASIEDAEAAAMGAYKTPRGTLSVTAPLRFGELFVRPVLQDFLDMYPGVKGNGLFVDHRVNLVADDIDVAVRIGHLPDSSLRAIKVGEVYHQVLASPAYLAMNPQLKTPDQLSNHKLIGVAAGWSPVDWQFSGVGVDRIAVYPALTVNTISSAIGAMLDGWGISRVISYQARDLVAQGQLVELLKDYRLPPYPVHVVHAHGQHAPAKIRAFVDLLVTRLRTILSSRT